VGLFANCPDFNNVVVRVDALYTGYVDAIIVNDDVVFPCGNGSESFGFEPFGGISEKMLHRDVHAMYPFRIATPGIGIDGNGL
jgi:hypothetical protein